MPDHAEEKDRDGTGILSEVPFPPIVKHYNMYMAGVNKSDQLVNYHMIV